MDLAKCCCCLLFILTFFLSGDAQPMDPENKWNPIQLKRQKDDLILAGEVAVMKAIADPEGDRYFLDELNLRAPVVITLISTDPDATINMNIHKYNWRDAEKSVKTDKKGTAEVDFRTRGEAGIHVFGSDSVEYYLIAWVGDPPSDLTMSNPFVQFTGQKGNTDAPDKEITTSEDSNFMMYIIAFLLLVLIVIGIVIAKRLGKGHAASVWLIIGLSLMSMAASPLRSSMRAMHEAAQDMEDAQARRDMETRRRQQAQIQSALNDLNSRLTDAQSLANSLQSLIESYEGLSEGDRRADLDPRGTPGIPSICVSNEACSSCFEAALGDFNETRRVFTQLEAIYTSTKTFVDNAIAFGDNASGVHAVTGLAWQAERKKIQESFKGTTRAY
ncbi:MAG: hypothetical protein AAFV80_24060, partial [Bacteroidota bacterium]